MYATMVTLYANIVPYTESIYKTSMGIADLMSIGHRVSVIHYDISIHITREIDVVYHDLTAKWSLLHHPMKVNNINFRHSKLFISPGCHHSSPLTYYFIPGTIITALYYLLTPTSLPLCPPLSIPPSSPLHITKRSHLHYLSHFHSILSHTCPLLF